jgi:hypothetical protein
MGDKPCSAWRPGTEERLDLFVGKGTVEHEGSFDPAVEESPNLCGSGISRDPSGCD